MAKDPQRSALSRLADVGEEAIQRLGAAPGGDRVLGAVNTLKERVDDMQKNVRAIPGIEKRLAAIEQRLDKLEGKSTSTPRKQTTSSSSSRKKTSS
jgi:hypothetical protein